MSDLAFGWGLGCSTGGAPWDSSIFDGGRLVATMRANVTPGFNSLVCSSQPCGPGTTVNPWSASGGNPHLRPWEAKAADVAYEWYVSPATYLSVAGFYKKLDTYIYQQTGRFDFTGIPIPVGASIPAGTTINPMNTLLPISRNRPQSQFT